MNVLISLFDHSGNWSSYFDSDPEWDVIRVDIKNGIDIMDWDYWNLPAKYYHLIGKVGILAACPCTDYALSGAAHFKKKRANGVIARSNLLVKKTMEIIRYFSDNWDLQFWAIEQPMTTLHKENPEVGEVKFKFNPCDFAGYAPNPEIERYNKETWLFGNFNLPEKKRLSPLQKEFPGHTKLGGKSERTKELRSITPLGFSRAFYEAQIREPKQPKLF